MTKCNKDDYFKVKYYDIGENTDYGYRYEVEIYETNDYEIPIMIYNAYKILINKNSDKSKSYLICIDKLINIYIYIGENIISFVSENEIEQFFNDYNCSPYAIDNINIYLINYGLYIKKSDYNNDFKDIYSFYTNNKNLFVKMLSFTKVAKKNEDGSTLFGDLFNEINESINGKTPVSINASNTNGDDGKTSVSLDVPEINTPVPTNASNTNGDDGKTPVPTNASNTNGIFSNLGRTLTSFFSPQEENIPPPMVNIPPQEENIPPPRETISTGNLTSRVSGINKQSNPSTNQLIEDESQSQKCRNYNTPNSCMKDYDCSWVQTGNGKYDGECYLASEVGFDSSDQKELKKWRPPEEDSLSPNQLLEDNPINTRGQCKSYGTDKQKCESDKNCRWLNTRNIDPKTQDEFQCTSNE